MKKTIAYILVTLVGIFSLSSCHKDNEQVSKMAGEWILELEDDAFDSFVANEDLPIPMEANGLAIIYHFNDDGTGWKEMDIMEDSYIVFVPYDRFHTLFRYTVSSDGKVDISFLDEEGEDNEEGDELLFNGKTLTNTVFDQTLVFTRATEEQINWYQDEADAWYGGSEGDGHPVTGVGEGWNWVGEIAATAVDR